MDNFPSGEELFQNLQNGTIYDVTLLDIHMDRISGITFQINRKTFPLTGLGIKIYTIVLLVIVKLAKHP